MRRRIVEEVSVDRPRGCTVFWSRGDFHNTAQNTCTFREIRYIHANQSRPMTSPSLLRYRSQLERHMVSPEKGSNSSRVDDINEPLRVRAVSRIAALRSRRVFRIRDTLATMSVVRSLDMDVSNASASDLTTEVWSDLHCSHQRAR